MKWGTGGLEGIHRHAAAAAEKGNFVHVIKLAAKLGVADPDGWADEIAAVESAGWVLTHWSVVFEPEFNRYVAWPVFHRR
ncbi:hypothetical protein [Kineosporia succinea]|uniref:Uncharacterized protein n=1 Tax=Kineosporia succinea TaxID=84632 RepID=A0ABT9P9P1_9ACTN|nr:hypothetical protein [Kineosporia succinea]MDP9829416.1 hypothetical protein [Kineosporia succinea]